MWGTVCILTMQQKTAGQIFYRDHYAFPILEGSNLNPLKSMAKCSMGMGIFTYIYHKFMVNVGKYSSPMEHLGMVKCWGMKFGARCHLMTPVLTKQAYARRGARPYSVYVETLEGPGFHWEWQEFCPGHPFPPAEVWYDWTPKMAQNIPKKHQKTLPGGIWMSRDGMLKGGGIHQGGGIPIIFPRVFLMIL